MQQYSENPINPKSIVSEPFDINEQAAPGVGIDPLLRYDPLISGIYVARFATPAVAGTLGCFLHVVGFPNIANGDYLLTNQHVLPVIGAPAIQPAINGIGPIPGNYVLGNTLLGENLVTPPQGYCNKYDYSLTVPGRNVLNEVPNSSNGPARNRFGGIGVAYVGAPVYKYGGRTAFTTGIISQVGWLFDDNPLVFWLNVVVVNTPGFWAQGDSGAVLVESTTGNNLIVALSYGTGIATFSVTMASIVARIGGAVTLT